MSHLRLPQVRHPAYQLSAAKKQKNDEMAKKKGNIFHVPFFFSLLFSLYLLFHVNELSLRVVELILQEGEFL